VQAPTLQMTVSADSITAAQRIRFDRPPDKANVEEAAMLQELKDRGYSWKGYAENGAWHGGKDTVNAWDDSTFRARVKKNVSGLSFFDMTGTRVDMKTYVEHIKSFDADALDDDLDDLAGSSVAPTPPTTPAKPASAPSAKRRRA
jgi:hypothetical protein